MLAELILNDAQAVLAERQFHQHSVVVAASHGRRVGRWRGDVVSYFWPESGVSNVSFQPVAGVRGNQRDMSGGSFS